MKALVIGSTGIIGNHVVRALLAQGIEVRGLQRGLTPALNLKDLNIEIVTGDATHASSLEKAIKGCDFVFHTAPYYPTNTFHLKQHCEAGVKGIQTVLKVIKNSSVSKFVYTSSLTTIGAPKKGESLADETCLYDLYGQDPHPYFAVKYLMEEEVRKASQEIPAIIVNPTGCFGPYELKPPHLCLVPQLVKGGLPAYVSHKINLVDVADVGLGHVLAAQKGGIGERYILGSQNTTTDWLIKTVCQIAQVKPPRVKLPLWLALGPAYLSEIYGLLTGKIPPLPILGLRFTQYGQYFSLEKAKKDLGYAPKPVEPCLERSIAWFRQIGYC